MKRITFRCLVDDDVSMRNPEQFQFYVMVYLNDPDGWAKHGYYFEPVSRNEDVLIRLCSDKTIEKECNFKGLSCAEMHGKHIYVNSHRWFHGSTKSKLNLEDYRQYLVSHEMGHILGHDHEKCECKGCKAPIMMQQTVGIGECKPSTKV